MNESLDGYSQVQRLAGQDRAYSAVSATGAPCRLQRFSLGGLGPAQRSEIVRSIRSDIQAVRELGEPCILAYSDAMADGDDVVVVSEPFDGVGLDAFLADARGEVDADTTWHVLHAVARAMNQAHGATDAAGDMRAICHGYLAPRHIRLASDGRVMVSGLGLAALVGSAELGVEGAFQAPEQREGGRITPRGDIYSIAAIAWMMLCGRPPGMPADFSEVQSKLPLGLRACFERCLEASASLRRMTTMELAHQLGEAVQPVGKQHLAVAVAALQARGSVSRVAVADNDMDAAETMMFGEDGEGSTAIVEDAGTMPRGPAGGGTRDGLPPLRSKLPTLRGGTDAVLNPSAGAPASATDEVLDEDLESTFVMDVTRLKQAAASKAAKFEDAGPPSSDLNWGEDSFDSTDVMVEQDSPRPPQAAPATAGPPQNADLEDSIRLEIPLEALDAGSDAPASVGDLSWTSDDEGDFMADGVEDALDAMQTGALTPDESVEPAKQASAFEVGATVAFDEDDAKSPLDDPRVLPRRGPESAPPRPRGLPPPRSSQPQRAMTSDDDELVSPGSKPPRPPEKPVGLPKPRAAAAEGDSDGLEALLASSVAVEPPMEEAVASEFPLLAEVDPQPQPVVADAAAMPSAAEAKAEQPVPMAGGIQARRPASAGAASNSESSPWGGGDGGGDAKKDKPISALAMVVLILGAMVATMGVHIAYTVLSNDPALPPAPPPKAAVKRPVKPAKATTRAKATKRQAPTGTPSSAASAAKKTAAQPSAGVEASASPAVSVAQPAAAASAAAKTVEPAPAPAPEPVAAAPAPVPTGKGSELPPDQGYLEVLFNGEQGGAVFFKRKMMGPVGQPIKVPCKDAHWVRIGKMPGPRWLSKGTTIRVKCQSLTKKFVSPR